MEQNDNWCGLGRHGVLLRVFGHVIKPELVAFWGEPEQIQRVFEAEVLPDAICLEVWDDLINGSNLFVFIDNEAAKASWIAGFVFFQDSGAIISGGTRTRANIDAHPFFCRVPTFSDYGDDQ